MDSVTSVVVGGSTVIALLCLPSVWRTRHSVWRQIIWTVILLIPVMGPVLYAGLFEPPPVKPKKDQPEFDVTTRGWK
jgi:hypothetical protein